MAKRRILRKQGQHISRLPSEPSSWGVRDRSRPAIIKNIKNNSLAATRCRLDGPFDEKTHPLPSEDAYMVTIQIQGTNSRELWLDGKPVKERNSSSVWRSRCSTGGKPQIGDNLGTLEGDAHHLQRWV